MPPIAVSARPELVEGSRISVHTLGCKLNYAETSTIARSFVERGLALVPFDRETDVFVLNTCSVTENAEKECRQIVRRVLRQSPNAFVIATGCYAQLRPEELASIEGVDLVLGSKEKQDAIQYAGGFEKSKGPRIFVSEISDTKEFHFAETSEGHGHTRAFLKVQDGCDYSCSFCTIPMARGGSRSAKIEDITRRARALCADGFREIVLSGVNAGDFGRKSGTSFFELMLAMERDPEITARIRISSIEPNLLTDDIIDLVAASQKFCPHFHIPLQSGSDRILRLMKRRYAVGTYQAKIAWIKTSMPDACIGADVIAGFLGETDEDFRETCDFIRSLDLSYLHVFTFSERPGTKASTMPDAVPIHIRRDRTRLLRVISEKKRRAFHAGQIGREAEILVEQGMQGYSRNYVRARLTSDAPRGAIVRASLKEMNGDAVLAEPFEILKAPREEGLLPIL